MAYHGVVMWSYTQDKSNPKDWKNAEGVTIIPPESEVVTGIDNVKKFFSAGAGDCRAREMQVQMRIRHGCKAHVTV